MSAVVEHAPPDQDLPRPRTAALLRAEVHRFRSRRFIQVLVALTVVGFALATLIGLLNLGTPTDAEYADAVAEAERVVAEQEGFREECLENATDIPDDVPPEEWCGPALTVEDVGGPEAFLDREPFDLAADGTGGALAVAALSAALAFLIGATWIGAEWSTRSIVALLFWVPRRMSVIGSKVAVLAGAAVLFGVLTQALWLAMAGILHATAGLDQPLPAGFWSELLQTQGRAVGLTLVAALLGFGLANLVRNTGAALGIAFVYVVVVENAVRALRPHWDPYLLSTNAVALVQDGGYTVQVWDDDAFEPVEHLVSHLDATLLLAAVTVVVLGVGTWLFARRDLH
ncbi:ABC transporter permease subunit [Blastococcus sp. TF02A-26]|uniref:ABC transporter permease subunit n=1 Tax=Blastococcus sp. TF02A-26 TaxID=2250577 RepID=UPI000DEA008B|nr:ABC transporter permease subunit [Blastococcus sp. TF02A-26]RBY88294.1 hypothetical protein DQ240_05555 [Blastococcus sp. TF02A-26]